MSLKKLAYNTLTLKPSQVKHLLLIGQCIPCDLPKAAKVRVQALDFDSFLKMYFPKHINIYTSDEAEICKDGDIVLIRRREEQLTRFIKHDLVKILYPFGDVTDPITGEKCAFGTYRKTTKLQKELYGVAEDGTGGFDYDSAPPRGWQEGKKDFTHKDGYKKFHNFEPGHPLFDDPAAW